MFHGRVYKNGKALLRSLVLLVVVGGVALLGIHLLNPSSASTGLAVPIPTNEYWGFNDNTYNDTKSVAPASCQQGGQTGIECEITWAAKQQSLAFPYAAASDGYLYNSVWHQYYKGCDDVASSLQAGTADYKQATMPGRKLLMINTKCGEPNDLTDGSQDASIKSMTDVLDKLPIPVIATYHHEPENDGCSATFNPDTYRAGYAHFASVIRAEEAKNGKHNIDIGWILQGQTFNEDHTSSVFTTCAAISGSTASSPQYRNPENWYPGDNVIDWIGDDPYNGQTFTALAQPFNDWGACPAQHPSTNWSCTSARINKPKLLAEFGFGLQKNANPPDATAAWIDGMRTALDNGTMSHIKAYTWYKTINTTTSSGAAFDPNFLEAKALARLSFDPKIAIPIFGSGGGGGGGSGGGTADTTKPSVKIVAPTTGTTVSNTYTASATASDNVGVAKVEFMIDGALKATVATAPYNYAFDSKTLANGSHTFQLAAFDAAGNEALSGQSTFTVSNTIASTAPSKPTNITSSSQTAASITLSWPASTDPDNSAGQISYHVSRNGTEVGVTAAGTTSYTDSGLSPATTYSYTIQAADPAGNRSAISAAFTQATKSLNCAVPAAPVSFTSNATATTVNLAWSAVSPPSSSCTIKNYVVQKNGVTIASPTTLGYVSTGLTPSTKYSFTVFAITTDNTAGTPTTKNATTIAAIDTTPPTAPTTVVAVAASSTQINLSWVAASDAQSSIKTYHILRNGQEIGTATSLGFGDSGLKADTTYSYQVVAENGAGLKTASATSTGKTLAAPTSPSGSGGTTGTGTTSGGTGSSSTAAKSEPVIPALVGTTSVGSGNDTGVASQQITDNPTAAAAISDNPSLPATSNKTATSVSPDRRGFALVSTIAGSLLLVAGVIAAVLIVLRRRRSRAYFAGEIDKDALYSGPTANTSPTVDPPTENKENRL